MHITSCLGVYGLGEKTNKEEIRTLFSNFGQLSKIEVLKERVKKQTMGFAFVFFVESTKAKLAQASLNGIKIDERKIVIDFPFTDPEWKETQTFSDTTSSSNSPKPSSLSTTPLLTPIVSSDLKNMEDSSPDTSHSAYVATSTKLYLVKIDGSLYPNFM